MSGSPEHLEGRALPEPSLTEARLARQWAAIGARREGRRAWPKAASLAMAATAFVALLALVAVLFVARRGDRATPFDGAVIQAGSDGHTWTMPDGAEVKLAAAATLRVTHWSSERVVLTLERGEARFDVPHVEGRSWTIRTGRFDVRVVGTRFTVRRGPDEDVEVTVERGRVEVASHDASAGDVRALGPGEVWRATARSAAAAPRASATETAGPPEAPSAPRPEPSDAVDADPPDAGEATPAPPAAPSWEALARARKYREAYDALGPAGFRAALDGAGPERLFRLAETARASGHMRDAETAFDQLRRRHRGDARAGLAAFELGRMRMDSLGNPGGAIEALGDAIQLAPGAPFREDAEARRVMALSSTGATAACEQAKAAYLSRYPSGAHAAVVASRCAPRR